MTSATSSKAITKEPSNASNKVKSKSFSTDTNNKKKQNTSQRKSTPKKKTVSTSKRPKKDNKQISDFSDKNLELSADQLLIANESQDHKNSSMELQVDSEMTDMTDQELRDKALANIKLGPKGVYTEDSIRVYLQEIGRIRLLRPDEEIELARKIADLTQFFCY